MVKIDLTNFRPVRANMTASKEDSLTREELLGQMT